MGEINNIARLLEAQQFGNLERDQDSQRIADFLITGELKKDRLQEALDQMDNVAMGAAFDAELLGTGQNSLEDCLANIREFMGLKLDNLKVITELPEVPPEVKITLEVGQPVSIPPVILPGGIKLEMVAIPAGSFMMGSNEYDSEKPIHQVTLKEYYLGKYPVTQEQYQAVMGSNPSHFKDNPKNPVESVNWHDAQAFCQKLNQITGKKFRLPTGYLILS